MGCSSPALVALALSVLGGVTCLKGLEYSPVPEAALRPEKAAEGGRPRSGHARRGGAVKLYTAEVVNEYPHDPAAFTQGLLYAENGTLYESTGLYGESSIREVLLQSGEVQAIYHMDPSIFGEGLTLLGERLFQVTWKTKNGFIYDRYNFTRNQMFSHEMKDGWGLTTDGKIIYGSDGTSSLYHLDPHDFKAIKVLTVKYDGLEVINLNELEYMYNEVWANVWQTDCVARISIEDGEVIGWIVLPKLREQLIEAGYRIDVLNGIAWDKENDRIFVTGKLWPKLYEIKLQEITGNPFYDLVKDICLVGASSSSF